MADRKRAGLTLMGFGLTGAALVFAAMLRGGETPDLIRLAVVMPLSFIGALSFAKAGELI